jgi:hypothetical protein
MVLCLRTLVGVTASAWGGDEKDVWWLKPENGGVFAVRSCDRIVEGLLVQGGELKRLGEVVYGYIWKNPAPSKVVVFS